MAKGKSQIENNLSELYHIALARIQVRAPFIIVENDWYLVFESFEGAIRELVEISLKHPVNLEIGDRTPIKTPRKLYWVRKFTGEPKLGTTGLKIQGELIEWIGYQEIKWEVVSFVSELFGSEPQDPKVIRNAVIDVKTKYDVVKIIYRDKYEAFGEVWLLRRFRKETMEKNHYPTIHVGRKGLQRVL